MSIHSRSLLRSGMLVLSAVAVVSCGEAGLPDPDSSRIVFSLSPASASVEQGGTATVTATLTREGVFTGPVVLSVADVPGGMRAEVSAVQTAGAVATATITVTVDAAALPGTYELRLTGSSDGVRDGAATYMLTVMAPPGYSLYLLSVTPTVMQGGQGSEAAITLNRIRFAEPVALSVENLPPGVYASLYPEMPTAEDRSLLYLSADDSAVPGVYGDVLLRGVAPGLPDRTVPLTLTVRQAVFTLTLPSSSLTIARGAEPRAITVGILRHSFPSSVLLHLDQGDEPGSLPSGVTAAFEPGSTTGDSAVLTIAVDASAVAGDYDLYLWGEALLGVWWWFAPLRLTITAAP